MTTTQTDLRKALKIKVLNETKRITEIPLEEDIYMVYYACKEHGLYFWRNIKTNHGMCFFCKQDYGMKEDSDLKDWHISDKELTEEIQQIVEDKINERWSKYRGGDITKVEESKSIDDGKYFGKIKDVTEKTTPQNYEYIHFVIEFDVEKDKVDLDFSCPANIKIDKDTGKAKSQLAVTLEEFNFKIEKGQEITIDELKKHFVGLKVSSLIKQKKTDRGTFANVMTMTPTK